MSPTVAKPYPYPDAPRLPPTDSVNLNELLRGSGPLEIEIGPGRGAFVLGRCVTQPQVRILGIEIRRKWASLVDRRLHREGFGGRARVVCEDARWALAKLGPAASVATIFLHFPDPWWKKRHRKRLVVTDELLGSACRLLADGGELFVQTDVLDRAQQYETMLSQQPELVAAGDQPDCPQLAANPYGALSNREGRAQADGLPIHRLRYQRRYRG